MQILFVNQYFPPDTSATAYLIGELAEDLVASGNEVTVLSGAPSYNADAGTFRPRGVAVRRAPSTAFTRASMLGRLLNYATYVASSLVTGFFGKRPDLVVGMTDPPLAAFVAALLALRHRVPFVFVCFDLFPHTAVALGRVKSRRTVAVWNRLNAWVWRRAVSIVVVARDMKAALEAHGVSPDKITFIPNWANDVAVTEHSVREWRDRHGWEECIVVMHAGNVGLAQGLDTVVEVARLCRGRHDLRFVFLGDGAAKESLVRQARSLSLSNTEFLPQVSKEEAHVAIAAADVHLVVLAPGLKGSAAPSKLYGILAAGKPFIASVEADTEPALTAEEHGAGLRVAPGSPEVLAAALVSLDQQKLEEMGARAREAFVKCFDRELATRQYARLFEACAGGGAGWPASKGSDASWG